MNLKLVRRDRRPKQPAVPEGHAVCPRCHKPEPLGCFVKTKHFHLPVCSLCGRALVNLASKRKRKDFLQRPFGVD